MFKHELQVFGHKVSVESTVCLAKSMPSKGSVPKDELDGRLDLPSPDHRLGALELLGLPRQALEHVHHHVVHDTHGLLGDLELLPVDLLEHLVHSPLEADVPCLLGFLVVSGLLGTRGRGWKQATGLEWRHRVTLDTVNRRCLRTHHIERVLALRLRRLFNLKDRLRGLLNLKDRRELTTVCRDDRGKRERARKHAWIFRGGNLRKSFMHYLAILSTL